MQHAPGLNRKLMSRSMHFRRNVSIVVTLLGFASCDKCENNNRPNKTASPVWLVDATDETGLRFEHTTGATGQFFFPEIMGSGCALLDYDNDGDLDIYVLQAHPLDATKRRRGDGVNRLYRNDLVVQADGSRTMSFVDVTDRAGVGDDGYGVGCAVGDVDNDGDQDIYVTNSGPNVFYRNNGDGTFRRNEAAVPAHDTWSSSAAFVDFDRDGWLDLFVADYVVYDVRENKVCHSKSSRRDYCGPQSFDPAPDHLFRNTGLGTFLDVSTRARVHTEFGSGLGVVCADFNDDGWPDIYVANDGDANQLWINKTDGTFENNALFSGAAYNAEGEAEAGMGVTAGDFDCDGDEDIFLAHLLGEHNTLLVNHGGGGFEDETNEHALGAKSRSLTAFGVGWVDIDNDGYLDLLSANGAVKIAEGYADHDYPYPFPNQLFRNLGPGAFRFQDVTSSLAPELAGLESSRGAAFGDMDNDGDTDAIISNGNGRLRLFRNEIGHTRSWLRLKLVGTSSNRDAIGAIVRLKRSGGEVLQRRGHTDGSYCSANDSRILFGLGSDRATQEITVRWPSGVVERFDHLSVEREHRIVEGEGKVPAP